MIVQQRQVENIIDSNSENKYIHHRKSRNYTIILSYNSSKIYKKFEIVIIMDLDKATTDDNAMHLVSCVITY